MGRVGFQIDRSLTGLYDEVILPTEVGLANDLIVHKTSSNKDTRQRPPFMIAGGLTDRPAVMHHC